MKARWWQYESPEQQSALSVTLVNWVAAVQSRKGPSRLDGTSSFGAQSKPSDQALL